jgi:TolB-like protein/DNA-binding winged helix-turn-helix (wHTH) protein/Tfp pilus assembly protein PilF
VSHPVQSPSIYRFGLFEADLSNRELRKHGIRVRLQEKPFQALIELLHRPGEVVTREELRQCLWSPDTFVDFDEGVNTAVKRLRIALGDSSASPIYIETVSRYGYRFIAPVTSVAAYDKPVSKTSPEIVLVEPTPRTIAFERQKPSIHQFLLWLSVVCGLLVILAVARYQIWRHRANLPSGTIQAIAVLPLENLSADPSQEVFADGITDEITTDLAKLAGPKVTSRTSALQYKGTHKTIPEIARDLNVGAIVEGSVERSADRIRVRVQLIQAATDRHLWAEEYDRQLSDVLQLEADVAQDIARQIRIELTPQQERTLARNRTSNPQAFQDYLQGRHYWALRTPESLAKAVEYFNRAIQEDPNDARSYAGLAHCYIVMPMLTLVPQSEAYPKARGAAVKALALDDSLAEAHLSIAEVRLFLDWDFRGAEMEFRKTVELNPNYSTGHQWYGEFLSHMGRHQEAIHELQLALALDPLSAVIHHQAAGTLQQARQYESALEQYHESLKLSHDFLSSYEAMYWDFRRQGKYPESIQSLRKAIPVFGPNAPIVAAISALEQAYAAGGKTGYLRQSLKVHEYYPRPAMYIAADYAELGDKENAILWLTRSYQNREIEALFPYTYPEFDSLRSDPRFQRLIRAVGFPQ